MPKLTANQEVLFNQAIELGLEGRTDIINSHEIPDDDGRTVAFVFADNSVSCLGMYSASRYPVWRHLDDTEAAKFLATHNL